MLDDGATEWRSGESFPHPVKSSSLVTDKNGGVVVSGGYSGYGGPLDTLYHLSHANAETWILMDQKLPERSFSTYSLLVTDDVCQPI